MLNWQNRKFKLAVKKTEVLFYGTNVKLEVHEYALETLLLHLIVEFPIFFLEACPVEVFSPDWEPI